ncbi:MAG: hypothetical protein R3A46_10720 [Thermomicrobiales bacterium]
MSGVLGLLPPLLPGIALTVLVDGTALCVDWCGALYGGWPELILGGLMLLGSLIVGLEAMLRQSNPNARTRSMACRMYRPIAISPRAMPAGRCSRCLYSPPPSFWPRSSFLHEFTGYDDGPVRPAFGVV